MLPFYIYRDAARGERKLMLMGVGTTDYLGAVCAPGCSEREVQGALELLSSEGGWDVCYATQLRPESMLARALRSYGPSSGFAAESCSRMPAVLFAGLPQKIRRNAMYYRNRALRAGTLAMQVADSNTWREAFDALVQLHTARWEARGEPGVLADPPVLAWHQETLPALLEAGLLRLCTLRLNDDMIAVLYSLIDPPGRPERTQYFYLPAYSPAHAELRPGTLLVALATDRAAEEGVRVIDMLRGDESYKQSWHVTPYPTLGFRFEARQHRPAEAVA